MTEVSVGIHQEKQPGQSSYERLQARIMPSWETKERVVEDANPQWVIMVDGQAADGVNLGVSQLRPIPPERLGIEKRSSDIDDRLHFAARLSVINPQTPWWIAASSEEREQQLAHIKTQQPVVGVERDLFLDSSGLKQAPGREPYEKERRRFYQLSSDGKTTIFDRSVSVTSAGDRLVSVTIVDELLPPDFWNNVEANLENQVIPPPRRRLWS